VVPRITWHQWMSSELQIISCGKLYASKPNHELNFLKDLNQCAIYNYNTDSTFDHMARFYTLELVKLFLIIEFD